MHTMSRSLITQETSMTWPTMLIRRTSAGDQAANLQSKFIHEKHPALMSCNLEVGVNGEEVFRLHMKPLLARCGLLVKLVKEANAIRPREAEIVKSILTVELENFPGGAEAFELAAKFCYCEADVPITLTNVTMLRCVAEFLEMTEDYGKANLCRKTEYFLKHEVFWNWNDTLGVLKSCEPFLVIAEKCEIIQRCVKALAFRACSSPDRFSDPPSFSSDSLDLNFSSGSNSSRSSVKSPISGNWWFQDLSSLSLYLMERVVRALFKHGIDHKNLAKFLLHYLRSSLPPVQFGAYGIFGRGLSSNLPSPCTSGRRCLVDEKVLKTPQNHHVEILETVVELLSDLQPRSVSCRSLFGLLRTAAAVSACKSCRREIEKMIGLQLDKATLDNILIPAAPRRSSSLYDVDLIVRLSEHFLKDQAKWLSGMTCSHESERKCGSERKCEGELASNCDVNSPVRIALLRVGELIDKYLAEVAADCHLKPAKFRTLAEILPDTARNSSDGLYQAVEIFLEAHPNLPATEATGLCRVISLQKLGLDACKRVAQNPKFPASFVLKVVLLQQNQMRSNMDSCLPRDWHDLKRKSSTKEMYSYNREGRLSRQSMVVHLECSNFEFMVRQNQDLKRNLKKMHTRVAELESTYKRLRFEMGRLFKMKRRPRSAAPQPQQKRVE